MITFKVLGYVCVRLLKKLVCRTADKAGNWAATSAPVRCWSGAFAVSESRPRDWTRQPEAANNREAIANFGVFWRRWELKKTLELESHEKWEKEEVEKRNIRISWLQTMSLLRLHVVCSLRRYQLKCSSRWYVLFINIQTEYSRSIKYLWWVNILFVNS